MIAWAAYLLGSTYRGLTPRKRKKGAGPASQPGGTQAGPSTTEKGAEVDASGPRKGKKRRGPRVEVCSSPLLVIRSA